MMNANLKVGTEVVLVERSYGYENKRYGTVYESGSVRLRIKWSRTDSYKDGVMVGSRVDTKRTWIACDRLRIVPTRLPEAAQPAVGPGGWCLDTND